LCIPKDRKLFTMGTSVKAAKYINVPKVLAIT